nr:MAG: capsid protein [Cressdnaviricota sp.]
MVFKKRYKTKNYRRARRPAKKSMDKEILKVVKRHEMREKPLKPVYVEYASTITTTPSLISPIAFPTQAVKAWSTEADSQGGRIGNQIYPMDWQLNIRFDAESSSSYTSNLIRMTIFQWKEDASTIAPVAGDIYYGYPGSYVSQSPLNPITKSKYRILLDKTFLCTNDTWTQNKYFKLHFKKFPITKMIFSTDSTTGTSATLVCGGVYMFITSDSNVIDASFSFSSLFTYSDSGM